MVEQTSFTSSRVQRDHFCKCKDAILLPILRGINIINSANFHAILMPALYGAEAFHLVSRGIPASNLFSIENNSVENGFDVHSEIVACNLPDRQELKGMRTTGKPERLSRALDEAYWCFDGQPYNLIYLDFLSRPDYETHYRNGLLKIMKAGMLAKDSTMILNFGKNRCRRLTAEFNNDLIDAVDIAGIDTEGSVPTEVYIGAAIKESRHQPYKEMFTKSYLSKEGRVIEYSTTVVKFKEIL